MGDPQALHERPLGRDAGLVAEVDDPVALVELSQAAWDAGLTHIEALSPYFIHDLPAPMLTRPRGLTRAVGLMALLGGSSAYAVLWLTTAWLYPLDVGGRALHSWLAFVPITFEATVLFTGITAFIGMLVGSGLPRLWRPLFEVDGFERVSQDRFWLWVSAEDPRFDPEGTRALLLQHGAQRVMAIDPGVRPREVAP